MKSEFYIDWTMVAGMKRDTIANDETGGRIEGATVYMVGGHLFFVEGKWDDLKNRFDKVRAGTRVVLK